MPDSRAKQNVLARVDDGVALLKAGRLEGALLSACVAIAGAARAAKPEVKSDRKAFVGFLEDQFLLPVRGIEYRGSLWTPEEIFYTWMRCELAHTAGLPVDIEWMEPVEPGAFGLRAGGAPEHKLLITPGWIEHLLGVAQKWAIAQT